MADNMLRERMNMAQPAATAHGSNALRSLLGFLSDSQSWKDMGRNALNMIGSPLPTQQEMMANALRMRLRGSVMRDYPGVETDLAKSHTDKMINLALGMNPVLATVWHGSPHKFDKFDMSKIGTGEGAQAYGHGLYFAESPAVAKAYAGANKGHAAAKDGWIDSLPKHMQMDVYKILQKDLPDVMRTPMLEDIRPRIGEDVYREVKNRIASSNLYKVDLPDDQIARMLDWDKPLSQQPEAVRMLAKDLGLAPNATGADFYKALSYQARDGAIARGQTANTNLGGMQSAASQELNALGIPGIRYLDGGSRGAGQGTSNFVVFDDRIPKILGRE